ncbi:asparagine-tRNA ligase [Plasmodium fragile]|uniref:asparagine--tRNA ligase n=1 Tax=Plasmodium fragile TaxID=5857 RepID=A0A0D9QPK5_PLAFR|nr:asparagine-tRNA ligase [Plasmodium fragile]KJP88863.1 asparagine-tRNA ligase [Plasmodium fragile]
MRGAFLFKDNIKYSWHISRGTYRALDWSRLPVRKRFYAKVSGTTNASQGINKDGEQHDGGDHDGRDGEAPLDAASSSEHLEPTGRTQIKDILHPQVTQSEGKKYKICGWVKSVRTVGKNRFSFVDVNDGSHVKNLQVVVDSRISNYEQVSQLLTDDTVECFGELKCSLGTKQQVELCVQDAAKAHYVKLLGRVSEGGTRESGKHYAIAKKYHTKEYLRNFPHLRARTKLYSSIFRLKSDIITQTFKFWSEKNCTYINTPVLTSNDCEGGGKLFHATTLMSQVSQKGMTSSASLTNNAEHTIANDHDGCGTGEPYKGEDGEDGDHPHQVKTPPFSRDFFKKPCYLNVSSQLALECLCCSMGDVFTLNQSFRAENSNTVRHLSEFLMMEVELAFSDLASIITLAEEYIKAMVKFALHNSEDINYMNEQHDEKLKQKLQNVLEKPFAVITYDEAVQVVKEHMGHTDVPLRTGDLTFEEQKFLTDVHFRSPVVVINYPQDMKPFYMTLNEDGKTVACMDVLLPGVGEVVGGSEREIRIHTLERRMKEKGLDVPLYEPYLQLRRYGNVPHAGFGLGMDRLIMFLTSMSNIRDVVPFPRTPGSLFM